MRKFKVVLIFLNLLLTTFVIGGRIKRQDETEDDEITDETASVPCQTQSGESGLCKILTACSPFLSEIKSLGNNTCQLSDKNTTGVCCSTIPQNVGTSSFRSSGVTVSADETVASGIPTFGSSAGGASGGAAPASGFAARAFSAPVPSRGFAFNEPPPPLPATLSDTEDTSDADSQSVQSAPAIENAPIEEDSTSTGSSNTAEALHNLITFAQPEAQEIGQQDPRPLAGAAGRPRAGAAARPPAPSAGEFNVSSSGEFNASLANVTFSDVVSAFGAPTVFCGEKVIDCTDGKYRSIDGSCNNLDNPTWGKSHTAFRRMSFSVYADAISQPRVATNGENLPSCRLVSTSIVGSEFRIQPHVNSLFVTFGQFIDHDFSQTPTFNLARESNEPCCSDGKLNPKRHHECMPIEIPEDDPFFSAHNRQCMDFIRSLGAKPSLCSGPREQQNQLTSYLDVSQVYGNIDRIAGKLRDGNNGRLKSSEMENGKEFPPHTPTGLCKGNENKGILCPETGDTRALEQPVLAALHVIFLREHNRLAARLAKLNPQWDDETLFQEARRILIAEYQHIVYNEFLPLLLGEFWVNRKDLEPLEDGFFDSYDSTMDAGVLNEFATAAFRYGHSLVQPTMLLVSESGRIRSRNLVNHFLVPFNGSLLDSYLRGATAQSSQRMDKNMVKELTNHLFQGSQKFGLDLAALNCQRGRDHAIGSYTTFLDICYSQTVNSFDDLQRFMDIKTVRSLSRVYKDVRDIDLWVGGIAERPYPGAVIGPVFACIVSEQFKRLRFGDRFWYERGNTESSFTAAQLRQIRKSSLARLICDNSDVEKVQSLAFIIPSRWNPTSLCKKSSAIPRVSLKPWKNEPTG